VAYLGRVAGQQLAVVDDEADSKFMAKMAVEAGSLQWKRAAAVVTTWCWPGSSVAAVDQRRTRRDEAGDAEKADVVVTADGVTTSRRGEAGATSMSSWWTW
jgi:hypothetical protein